LSVVQHVRDVESAASAAARRPGEQAHDAPQLALCGLLVAFLPESLSGHLLKVIQNDLIPLLAGL
jgi:hypothetical protein